MLTHLTHNVIAWFCLTMINNALVTTCAAVHRFMKSVVPLITSLVFLLISSGYTPMVHAQAFTVSNIRVEGLQRVDFDEMFASLPIQVGDDIDQSNIAIATRQLFKSGYFSDIRIARDGDELVVVVEERPAIAGIDISGNKLVKTEQLQMALAQANLVDGEIFKRSTLAQIELEMEREYNAEGRYAVAINTEITDLGENRVGLQVKINEGVNSTIAYINIIGNETYSNDQITDLMSLKIDSFWSLFTKSSQYSRHKLTADLEAIRSFYLDRGHVHFDIESTQVSISPDQTEVFITINVVEGPVFDVGNVVIVGQAPVLEEQIRSMLDDFKGTRFSRQRLVATAREIEQLFGDEGFTFARVEPVPQVAEETDLVNIQFVLRPGQRTYVRRINFNGNTKTSDEVLRREMRVLESAPASFAALRTSRLRLQRLGFFSDVNVTTEPVLGTNDVLDVNVDVVEGLTNSWSVKLGYTDGVGPFWGGSLTQRNLLGTGNSMELDVTKSDSADNFKFSYFDPYYTVDGVSQGFDVYYSKRDFSKLQAGSYAADRIGIGYKLGYPLSETATISYEIDRENVEMMLASGPSTELQSFVNREGSKYQQLLTKVTISDNSLNDYWYPTQGRSHSVNLEVALPVSDLDYYRSQYQYRYFTPITSDERYVFSVGANIGYAKSYGDTTETPPYANFFAGGYGSVRGFNVNSLGPQSSTNVSLGGQILTTVTGEIIVPIINNPSVRTSLFLDVGNTFTVSAFDIAQLRSSTGLNLSWLTPVGPLTFVMAWPVKSQEQDQLTRTHITLGRSF